jgi:mannose-6-phosphate isomerase class I
MSRNTSQHLLPIAKDIDTLQGYDIYPTFPLKRGNINSGYSDLANEISCKKIVILDGYIGVDWDEVSNTLSSKLQKIGLTVNLVNIDDYLKDEEEIIRIVKPYLGEDDSIFGHRTNLDLNDYFDQERLEIIQVNEDFDITLIYGTGAGLCNIEGFLIYFDLPKNELQYRMRSHNISNLGLSGHKAPKEAYKHFYFVDWVVLNKEKKRLLPDIQIIVDQQRPNQPTWTSGSALRATLNAMSQSYFRVRPWFEPGVWGGQWMKNRFEGLPENVPNYAWSFEMIVPENGILLESNGYILEISFDMLMFQENNNVLGKAANRFKDEFPIRFDFLDTFEGGNLSVQCHPTTEYIRKEFGENFTQDETYYIMDAGTDAQVYLGFQEDIEPEEFKAALERCFASKKELDVEKYIQKFPAKKHDLFLIPNGTIHCSGIDNMVLEISATPYIFTFKMYDWQRLDLDGQPRPLNIEHAFNNLNFSRKGKVVEETLISKPYLAEVGTNWKKIHLPTHPDHFYSIYRYEFEYEVEIETNNQCHILMLVEGQSVELNLADGTSQPFKYAETFAIPAATRKYRLVNTSKNTAKIILSHVKDEAC